VCGRFELVRTSSDASGNNRGYSFPAIPPVDIGFLARISHFCLNHLMLDVFLFDIFYKNDGKTNKKKYPQKQFHFFSGQVDHHSMSSFELSKIVGE